MNDTAGSGASSGKGNFINSWRKQKMNKRQAKKNATVEKDVKNFMKNTEEKAMSTENTTNKMVEEKLDEKNTVEEVTEIAKEIMEEIVNPINSNIILDKGDRCIRCIMERNGGTGEITDIKFVLSENGKTYLGLEKLISIPVKTIFDCQAKSDCLTELKRYDYSITDEELKKAWENLQEIVRYRKFIYETDELAVTEALDMVIENVEFMILESEKMSPEEKEEFYDKYRKDGDTIMIRTEIMNEVLETVGAEGYTKIKFCKRVRELEQFEQKKILISNRAGNKGYDFNTTGNKAFYKIVRNWRDSNV